MVECSGGITIDEINEKISDWVRDVIHVAKGNVYYSDVHVYTISM